MPTYQLKVWTGPTLAVELGRRVRRAGLKVPITGTEHIYVNVKGTSCAAANHNMRAALYSKYRMDWGLSSRECRLVRPKRARR
jgi:hypothetical protein